MEVRLGKDIKNNNNMNSKHQHHMSADKLFVVLLSSVLAFNLSISHMKLFWNIRFAL